MRLRARYDATASPRRSGKSSSSGTQGLLLTAEERQYLGGRQPLPRRRSQGDALLAAEELPARGAVPECDPIVGRTRDAALVRVVLDPDDALRVVQAGRVEAA